jgi:hypothetical protein
MLECHDMSLVPMVDVDYDVGGSTGNSVTQILSEVDDPTEWCLFAIDVRNTYGLPFEVTFEREQAGKLMMYLPRYAADFSPGTKDATVSSTVPPGSMSR